jgi:hypothetical protein
LRSTHLGVITGTAVLVAAIVNELPPLEDGDTRRARERGLLMRV